MPSMDHPWMAGHLPFPFCLSIRGCQSYCAIHGPSMDGQPPCPHPLSKYPWMPELLCHPWTIRRWPATSPSPLCLSIRGCQSDCAVHGPSMDGQSSCPQPPSKYPWMPESLCHPWTIHGWPVTLSSASV